MVLKAGGLKERLRGQTTPCWRHPKNTLDVGLFLAKRNISHRTCTFNFISLSFKGNLQGEDSLDNVLVEVNVQSAILKQNLEDIGGSLQCLLIDFFTQ